MQLMDKDPEGGKEFSDQFTGRLAKGHALTMRDVQMTRPSIFERGAELEPEAFNRVLVDVLMAVEPGRWTLRYLLSQTGSAILPAPGALATGGVR